MDPKTSCFLWHFFHFAITKFQLRPHLGHQDVGRGDADGGDAADVVDDAAGGGGNDDDQKIRHLFFLPKVQLIPFSRPSCLTFPDLRPKNAFSADHISFLFFLFPLLPAPSKTSTLLRPRLF